MKIKTRNFIISFVLILVLLFTYFTIKLQPLFEIQIKAHFHEKVIYEIMDSVHQLEIPNDFIIREEKNTRVNTNQLNEWIVEVNQQLNKKVDDKIETNIPFGYLTGIDFIQNWGPKLSASFLVVNRITAQYDIKTTSLGINNVLIELVLNIQCKGNIYLGLNSNELIIQERIPLTLEYIQGDIPQLFPY